MSRSDLCRGRRKRKETTGSPSRTENTARYIIKKELRWQVRDLLDQLNISERIVYPGLDGLSMWLARHYYVK